MNPPAEWDQCSICGKLTTAGIVCWDCAAAWVKKQKEDGKTMVRVVIDGQAVELEVNYAKSLGLDPLQICPICNGTMHLIRRKQTCRWCGYSDDSCGT